MWALKLVQTKVRDPSHPLEASLISGHHLEILKQIIRAMAGVPLAIEQARAMIKNGIPVRDFLGYYETQYQKTMAYKPTRSAWDYEKNMPIISIFHMLLTRLDKDEDAENILAFASCFGPRQIAVNLMGQVHQPQDGASSSRSGRSEVQQTREMTWLDCFGQDRLAFQLATGQLESLCLLKLKRDSEGATVSISLHDSITRWRFETLTSDMRAKWIIAAAYALSKCLPEDVVDHGPQMIFLPLIRHFYSIIRRYIEPQKLEAPDGELCHQYGHLMFRFAPLYLNSGYTGEGVHVYSRAIQYQRIFEESSWPKDRGSLLLLKGLAMMFSKNGKMEDAAETTKTLHDASTKLFGPEDKITSWAAARLPAVREGKIRYAENEQRAVTASRGDKLSLMTLGGTPSELLQIVSQDRPRSRIPDMDQIYAREYTALTDAASGGHIESIRLILDRGTDVNAHGWGFQNALQWASQNGHGAVVQLLLDKGADVNARNSIHSTALHKASSTGHIAEVEILLNSGADVNNESGIFGTALHEASCKGHTGVVELLLSRGADVNMKSGIYGSALNEASCTGHTAVAELLLNYGANVNANCRSTGTPLWHAVANNDHKMVQVLLANGADVNAKNICFVTALQIARFRNRTEMIRLLLAAGARDDNWSSILSPGGRLSRLIRRNTP